MVTNCCSQRAGYTSYPGLHGAKSNKVWYTTRGQYQCRQVTSADTLNYYKVSLPACFETNNTVFFCFNYFII